MLVRKDFNVDSVLILKQIYWRYLKCHRNPFFGGDIIYMRRTLLCNVVITAHASAVITIETMVIIGAASAPAAMLS